jgi:hypothetical protein
MRFEPGLSNYYRESNLEQHYHEASQSFSNAIAIAIGNFVFFGLTLPLGIFFACKAHKHGHPRSWIAFAANLAYLPFLILWAIGLVSSLLSER